MFKLLLTLSLRWLLFSTCVYCFDLVTLCFGHLLWLILLYGFVCVIVVYLPVVVVCWWDFVVWRFNVAVDC